MDTSETYIKMCEKAAEIQEGHEAIIQGDWWCWKSYQRQVVPHVDARPISRVDKREKKVVRNTRIWLPRQDQLQEMVKEIAMDELTRGQFLVAYLEQYFDYFCNEEYANYGTSTGLHFGSMEQLWLAFVMKEKYNKIWNGDEWIDDKRITKQDSRGKT